MFDLRMVAIAASFILASIAVAAAERAPDQPAPAPRTESSDEARPIRVVLPAPWEAAAPGSTSQLRK
jgi:hypothetical protein